MVGVVQAGVPIFVEYWGDNLQFYPNFALFSTLGGMNLDHDFFQVSKLSKDPKKKVFPKLEHFFSPISSGNLRSQARSQKFAMGGYLGDLGPGPKRSKILHFVAKVS